MNAAAQNMIYSTLNHTRDAQRAVRNFLVLANECPGVAITSYYTQYNKAGKFIREFGSSKFRQQLLDNVNLNHDNRKLADAFKSRVAEDFSTSLDDRIALADHGAVNSDAFKPHNRILDKIYYIKSKFIAKVSKIIREVQE